MTWKSLGGSRDVFRRPGRVAGGNGDLCCRSSSRRSTRALTGKPQSEKDVIMR